MHVSRNKCELIAECCITGELPEYQTHPFRVTIKGVDITNVLIYYQYLQGRYKLSVEDFENITQVFYKLLNTDDDDDDDDDDACFLTINSIIAAINTAMVVAEEELKQINKNRELEEDIAYV